MAVFRAHGPVCGAVFVFFIKESGRSILRLKRRVRPCGDPERSGGAGETGEAGRSAALVFRLAPVRASEKPRPRAFGMKKGTDLQGPSP